MLQRYTGTYSNTVQWVLSYMELYFNLVGQTLAKTSEQGTSSCKPYSVLYNVGIKFRRCTFKGSQHSILYIGYCLVKAMGYLLIAYRYFHRQRCNTVRTINDIVLWCLIAKVGEC